MISETIDVHTQVQEKLTVFFWGLGFGSLMLAIAWHFGCFRSFPISYIPVIRGKDVLKGFGLFLFVEILLIPAIISLALSPENPHNIILSQFVKEWLKFLIILGGFGAVLLAYFELTATQRQQLWKQTPDPWYFHLKVAIAAWFITYPLILAFSQMVSLIVWYVFRHPPIEQVAVQHLRQALSDPWLFSCMALAVVTLVPFTEEFLFRGLLQSWLKQKLHYAPLAICLSSLLFTSFHYSSYQEFANIELLSSLFILSCVIGFIYERQRSLWAPIGLHGFFNLMSLILIFQESP